MKGPRFEVFKARDGWRWRLRGGNSRIVCQSEGYTTKASALRAAAALDAIAWEALGNWQHNSDVAVLR